VYDLLQVGDNEPTDQRSSGETEVRGIAATRGRRMNAAYSATVSAPAGTKSGVQSGGMLQFVSSGRRRADAMSSDVSQESEHVQQSEKRARPDSSWESYSEFNIENRERQPEPDEGIATIQVELEKYKAMPVQSHDTNIFQWWADTSFLILKKLAAKHLSSPATSVPSEQLFSTAGQIYDDNRSRLKPINAEKLLFLAKNMPIVNYEY